MGINKQLKVNNLEEILDKILLPFREEYRQKCRNESVIGGFDSYFINWTGKAIDLCSDNPTVKNILSRLSNKFKEYERLSPKQRADLLKKVHPVIKTIKEGNIPAEFTILEPVFALQFPKTESKKDSDNKSSTHSDNSKKVRESKKKTAQKLTGKDKIILLDTPLTELPGIGTKMADNFKKLKIRTVEDILFHLPREYQDRRNLIGFHQIEPGTFQVLLGTIGEVRTRNIRRNLKITKASFYDENGILNLTWFNQPYIYRSLKRGRKYIAAGKVEYKYNEAQINTPEIEEWDGKESLSDYLTPIYPLAGGLSQKFIRKFILSCVEKCSYLPKDVFPEEMRKRLDLYSIDEAIRKIHQPADKEEALKAKKRILFEEAFFMQLMIARQRNSYRKILKDRDYRYNPYFLKEFEDNLHFQLTKSQRKVIEEILEDIQSGAPMNRLLQGDVGSGKTIVCIFFTLLAVRAGYQVAIMAPTEVLAEQHYYNFRNMLKKFDIECNLLIGATPPGEKSEIKSNLESGELKVVVGTHALIQEDVRFSCLGFAVVDEQHKFGVLQRANLKEKGEGTDFLFTTATPIPRSLCFSLYGELDVSTIDELPAGRSAVNTMWITEEEKERVYNFVEKELKDGGQVYIICPLIEESEKLDLTPLTREFESVRERFPGHSVGFLHGRMKSNEKEQVMNDFSSGKHRILVSTTVVEVGVDVSNASIMVILDAQRYGLGQLHQLRGRVGRGERKSTCILVSSSGKGDSGKRLRILTGTNSGFEIAEEDLKLRGPGDLMGVRQSGLPELKFLNIVRDFEIIVRAREEAFRIERQDPHLTGEKFQLMREKVQEKFNKIWDIIH